MNVEATIPVLESLMLASDSPLPFTRFVELLPEATEDTIQQALSHLQEFYSGPGRGIHLTEVAGGYALRTNPAHGPYVRGLYESRPQRLSRAAMETLAIIAYRQPITRAEIEEIRGVDTSGVVRTLVEYGLIHVIGRLDDVGKPNLYATTRRFLEFFGLHSITDLPTLEDGEMATIADMTIPFDADDDSPQE